MEWSVKGKYIWWGFCIGGEIRIGGRGVLAKEEEVMCPSLGHMAGHGRERERDALNEGVGGKWGGILERVLEFGELEKSICLGEKGKENRKRKRKRINKEKIFSLGLKMKLMKRLIPGLKSKMWKSFRKMPESSEIQVFRNDSKIYPKINNNIWRLIVKSFLRNTL